MTRWLALAYVIVVAAPALGSDEEFERSVRPLLVERCQKCHGAGKSSGGLRLDSREAILKGGDTGPAAVEGKPDESLIVQAIEQRDELRMPPKGKLEAREIAVLRRWIEKGAAWPSPGGATEHTKAKETVAATAGRDWWSFQPLRDATPPAVKDEAWPRDEIDRFLLAKLESRGLKPAPEADRRTWIRRATYDLTGLPPSAEEVDAFARDDAPDAFARLVDRLLASPAYGERWGRHWLDLVRYADTAGENSDHPTPHSWRYRNWVIDAFNRDVPYDEFVRLQVAGDLVAAGGPPEKHAEGIVATGFLAIARRFGHDIDKDVHLTHEDVIDTMGRTFLGLSIACARCHDHKYDPISARDYYALSGILQSTRFSFPGCEPKPLPRDLVPMMPAEAWARTIRPHREALEAIDAELKRIADQVAAESRRLFAGGVSEADVAARGSIPDGGSRAFGDAPGAKIEAVEVEPGTMLRLSVAPLGNHGADSTRVELEIAEANGPGRWDLVADVLDDLLAGNPHADRLGHQAVWWFLDGRPGRGPLPEPVRELGGNKGLHVWRDGDTPSVFANARPTELPVWTKLPPRSVFVHPAPDGPVAVGWVSPIRGRVTIKGRIVDAHPGGPDGVAWSIDRLEGDRRDALNRLAGLNARRTELARRRAELEAKAPRPELAYAVAEGTETDSPIHLRGDPEKRGPVVPRRWLEVLGGQAVPQGKGSGRRELAGWLTSPTNPLAARVMVNRIWQGHFGRGLVATPSDFGTRGMPPTHPELLDWLASRFIKDGWSVKAMHRRILLSAAYRQASTGDAHALELDPDNALRGRFGRRRLDAEEIRDSLLIAGGSLDPTPGGPHPFPPESSWSFTQHNPFQAFYETDRRSVYLVSLRNRRQPFLGLFDGADPNATTPERQETTVPTQALFFLNDPFFHRQAGRLAGRAIAAGPGESARLDELYRLALQRAPRGSDRATAAAFLARYAAELAGFPPAEATRQAWSALARAVLASNEFLYQD
ncbi:Planctomycete cytochrome C [Aquisphaera giovannonii]|uniref:Planctomycete cytochrome C n=1 Tax=Aquisphaera giovannonii TaxID=406548 RepID=A0A5B9W5V3_9BACT|nr:PSD1 and planctomycete cytochrome C domain-containing protein [Aquisphaera giovannonii]QEH35519.1 Planctomycete cytochrome C [Aquisphaera giovannonii]